MMRTSSPGGGASLGREERQRLARVVDDQVLEVLVVADRVRHALRPECLAHMVGQATGNALRATAEKRVGDHRNSRRPVPSFSA